MNTWLRDLITAVFKNIENIILSNEKFNILGFNYNLLYFIILGAWHKWFRLFWLRDLAQYCMNKEFDLDTIIELSKIYKVEKLTISSLLFCSKIFDVPGICEVGLHNKRMNSLLDAFENSLSKSELFDCASSYKLRIKEKIKSLKINLQLGHGYRYKISALGKNFISSTDIEMLPLSEKLFFLYYPLHLILGPIRWYKLRKAGRDIRH